MDRIAQVSCCSANAKMRKGSNSPMPRPKPTPRQEETVHSIEKKISRECQRLAEVRNAECFPLILGERTIGVSLVDEVYDELTSGKYQSETLDVIVESGGGNIHAAYNLALLFRQHGSMKLTFIVPRWAKSAATLLICGGDEILMTPVAELGPLDPQITATDPFQQRMESFSPLHIESTLQLIRDEFRDGSAELAKGLMQRLQFPLTLGSFKKSLDVGREYLVKLLSARMLKGDNDPKKAERIGDVLTTGYADHGWCITVQEAKDLGLSAHEIDGDALKIVWKIHKLSKRKSELYQQEKRAKIEEKIKEIQIQETEEFARISPSLEPKEMKDFRLGEWASREFDETRRQK